MKFNNKKFAKALKAATNGHIRAELSRLIKVDRTALIRYERGDIPGTVHFARICNWLGADMESFFTTK